MNPTNARLPAVCIDLINDSKYTCHRVLYSGCSFITYADYRLITNNIHV